MEKHLLPLAKEKGFKCHWDVCSCQVHSWEIDIFVRKSSQSLEFYLLCSLKSQLECFCYYQFLF